MCLAEAPELFDVTDQGRLYDTVKVLEKIVDADAYQRALSAASVCPNGVITVLQDDATD